MSGSRVPQSLIDEILDGNCVAFVGAGFVAPAMPTWDDLLRAVAQDPAIDKKDEVHAAIVRLLDNNRPADTQRGIFDREAAAQMLEQHLGSNFGSAVQKVLSSPNEAGRFKVRDRLRALQDIPFQAVLTTNFDTAMDGQTVSPEIYSEALRRRRSRWFDYVKWGDEQETVTPTVLLHGRLGMDGLDGSPGFVLSRSSYRKLLFESPGYSNFLRALMATRTILFMGFSFSDAYLNLIRSEVLSFLFHEKSSPLAYAILDGLDEQESEFLYKYEGIYSIQYEVRADSEDPHQPFDSILDEIRRRTSAKEIIDEMLVGKRLLWIDEFPHRNAYGYKVLDGSDHRIVTATSVEQALVMIEQAEEQGHQYDLVISYWGHGRGADGASIGEQLLTKMRSSDFRSPVIFFAAPDGPGETYASTNRRKAISLGAFEYAVQWPSLFSATESLFSPAK